ncbi:TonB-dependent receptor [Spirosoma sp. HMF4905]|uniref:TonB-dependent receptor n=1 Tax=Spirosoma arboris TaxID=2682092 RepID=A0A7K1SDC8_9BACT|nr:TonB-dependent receptor [Spirosoma arboris]MVM31791.1 TonB-dependent receptor [Spirosoma arboris]
MKSIANFLVWVSISLPLQAQTSSKLIGRVQDASTKEPIPFANAVLTDSITNVRKAAQTDVNGTLILENLPNGLFSLTISFVGYESVRKDSLSIDSTSGSIDVGLIALQLARHVLSEVTIIGKKAALQIGEDKKVFSVNQSLISEGGTASDLIQNVPTLQLDVDGNVNLRGSAGVKVLVDGKPSLIAGGTVSELLQSIPASSIETIEIIANPSAKYNAEGDAIINIVLKKNNRLGLNGSVALTGGTRSNYTGNAALSFQNSKVNVYGNYGYQHVNTYVNGFQQITYLNSAGPIRYSNETFPATSINKGHTLKAGADYFISEKNTLGFAGSFTAQEPHRNEFLQIDLLSATLASVERNHRNNTTNGKNQSYDISLDFTQKFRKPQQELSINFTWAHGTNTNYSLYETTAYNANGELVSAIPDALQDNLLGQNTNYNIQTDYGIPIGKSGKLETGYRAQISSGQADRFVNDLNKVTGAFGPNYVFTNFYASTNQVHALYVNYSNQIKNFSYQVGVRGEDADMKANLQSYDPNHVLYETPIRVANRGLYPNLVLTQKLNGDQRLKLSYSRRVNRPNAREINPFPDIADPVNYVAGNPNILPENIHLIEVGYSKNLEKITFTSNVYVKQTDNVIKRIEGNPVNSLIVGSYQNLNRAVISGLELIGQFTLVKAWEFTTNVNMYYRHSAANPQFGLAETHGLSWNANMTHTISVVKNLSLQLRADYRASDIIIQDLYHPSFGIDAGAKYDFPNRKASISFNARDVFYSRQRSFLRESKTVLFDFSSKSQSARAALTFSYRFGKTTANPKKGKKTDVQEKRIDEVP